jgi:hypothetical protein
MLDIMVPSPSTRSMAFDQPSRGDTCDDFGIEQLPSALKAETAFKAPSRLGTEWAPSRSGLTKHENGRQGTVEVSGFQRITNSEARHRPINRAEKIRVPTM